MILGAGYPKEVHVSVVIFSHLTTAIGFSVSWSATGKKSHKKTKTKVLNVDQVGKILDHQQ